MPSEKQMIIKAVSDLKELQKPGDIEIAHSEADKILLRFVPQEVKDEWDKVKKWYA